MTTVYVVDLASSMPQVTFCNTGSATAAEPTFFKQEKEVIVSPIALLKTVSRKKNLAFSHITENSKDRFTFTEKGGQTRMPVKKTESRIAE